ncbi:MAG: TonB family protein [Thermodesulfobacteriota bacterium]
MNPESESRSFFFNSPENGYRPFLLTYAVSAGCHLVFFAIFILAPMAMPERKWSPSVVNVSLVSIPLPGERGTPGPPIKKEELPEIKKKEAPKPVPKPVKEEVPVKAEKAEEAIPLTPRSPVKLSLKKKTFQASKAIESAIKEIEKKADEIKPNELAKALDNLRQKVDTRDRNPGTGTGGGGEGGGKAPEQMDFYKVEIAYQIQKNWAFSEQLAGGRKDLSARLVIKILQNGNIQEVFFETKSGNDYFDDSAYKAIQKSNPLPPLPPGYLRPFYVVGLHFTPSGLN